MNKILLKLIEEVGIIILIWSAAIAVIIIFCSGVSAISEIEKNSYMELVIIPEKKIVEEIIGVASYYDYVLKSGWSSVGHLVCATRDFERYTMIKVTNLDNGKWVICKKTDYGPDESKHPDRVVDLSSTAFRVLAPLSIGLIKKVKIEKIND